MKRVLALVAAAGIISAASTAFALVKGGKHDMTVGGTATLTGGAGYGSSTQICVYCHTPHNSRTALPLWNRNASTNAAAFKLYSNTGMANKMTSLGGFTTDSPSLFCMSCHDGVTNINNVAHSGGGTLTDAFVGGNGKIGGAATGTDLTTTHPVNFPVKSNSQNDLWIGSAGKMGTNNTISGNVTSTNGFPLYKTTRDAGTNSLECSSCHSVHNYDNSPFLRYTMADSALCLGCHNK